MGRRTCRYFLSVASLLDDARVPDSVYRRYQKLLKESYELTGERYAPITLSNSGLAKLWQCNEDAARACVTQMRDLKLIETEQVGRTGRLVKLLIAWRSKGNDSAPETNAPEQRAASAVSAPTTTAQTPAQAIASLVVKGARIPSTLSGLPNVVVACTSSPDLEILDQQQQISNPGCTTREVAKNVRNLESGVANENSIPAQTLALLDRIEIVEPNRSAMAILEHVQSDEYLLPWTHYAEDNPQLGGGYFVLRFKRNELAPLAYRRNADRREQEHLREIANAEAERTAQWQAERYAELDAEIAAEDALPRSPYVNTYRQDSTGDIWHAVLGELQLQMTRATFDQWLRQTRVRGWDGEGDTTLVVGARTPYAKEWLENRLQTTIQRTVAGIVGHSVTVRYEVIGK